MRVLLMPAQPFDPERSWQASDIEFKDLPKEAVPEAMAAIVGGGIEIVRMNRRLRVEGTTIVMVVDGEGALKNKPINWQASGLYGTQLHGHYIYGDVFLAGEGLVDGEPDFVDFPEVPIEVARQALTHHVMSFASVPSPR